MNSVTKLASRGIRKTHVYVFDHDDNPDQRDVVALTEPLDGDTVRRTLADMERGEHGSELSSCIKLMPNGSVTQAGDKRSGKEQ